LRLRFIATLVIHECHGYKDKRDKEDEDSFH